jgi:hypothetical protein
MNRIGTAQDRVPRLAKIIEGRLRLRPSTVPTPQGPLAIGTQFQGKDAERKASAGEHLVQSFERRPSIVEKKRMHAWARQPHVDVARGSNSIKAPVAARDRPTIPKADPKVMEDARVVDSLRQHARWTVAFRLELKEVDGLAVLRARPEIDLAIAARGPLSLSRLPAVEHAEWQLAQEAPDGADVGAEVETGLLAVGQRHLE